MIVPLAKSGSGVSASIADAPTTARLLRGRSARASLPAAQIDNPRCTNESDRNKGSIGMKRPSGATTYHSIDT
jgi:hypothetical protein